MLVNGRILLRQVQQNCRENILPTPVSWMFDVFSVFCCVFPAVLRGVVSGHDVSFPGRRRIAREPPLPSITCSFAHFRGKCNRIPQGKCIENTGKYNTNAKNMQQHNENKQKRKENATKYRNIQQKRKENTTIYRKIHQQ